MAVAGRSRWALCALGVISCLMLTAISPGVASAESLKQLSSFGPDGTEATDFGRIGSIALDQEEGWVYVFDSLEGSLSRFGPSGEPSEFLGTSPYIEGNRIDGLDPFDPSEGNFLAASQVAVDYFNDVVYVTEKHAVRAFHSDGEPAEFTAGPGAGSSQIGGFAELFGVAVDENGSIYASDYAGNISVFSSSGTLLTSFSTAKPHNLAVAPNGTVYVIGDSEGVPAVITKFTPSVFPVSGSTTYSETTFVSRKSNGSLIVGLATDPVTDDVYVIESNLNQSWIRRFDKAGTLAESIGEPGSPRELEALEGLSEGIAVLGVGNEVKPKEIIKFYLGSTPVADDSQVAIFGTRIIVDRPTISNLRVSDLSGDSALLRASVNANTKLTTYRFEYGLDDCSVSACTSVPLGGTSLGEGSDPVALSQLIEGLAPATLYHYRIVAENELGISEQKGTFKTQSLGTGFDLSDSRVWEMVSPPDKKGATLMGPAPGLIQAAADGTGATYLSRGSIEVDPDGNRSLEVSSVLSMRGPGGWNSKDITPANVRTVPLGVGSQSEYKLFTPALTRALLEPHDGTTLSPAASERTPYLREITDPPAYTPLVTGKEGYANVPPETVFGGDPLRSIGSVNVAGSNTSLTAIALVSEVPLVEGAPEPPLNSLYLWRAGQLQPVGELPIGEGGAIVSPAMLGSASGSVDNAISEDGKRVFWGLGHYGNGGSPTAFYLRDTEAEEAVRLDVIQPGGSGANAAQPAFQGATPDGTVVFFKDSQRLTADASPEGFDLYRCEIPVGNALGGCATLDNITAGALGGKGAEVLGLISGMAENGETLYFVAEGVLDSAPNEYGDSATASEPNLYRWKREEGIRFIATLSRKDDPNWGGEFGETNQLSSITSPDGRYLAFMSEFPLTDQPNADAETGTPVQEIFVYDETSDRLSCVSCNPSGAAPSGQISAGFSQLIDAQGQWEGQRVAAVLPQPSTISGGVSVYQPRAVLNSGRMFFNTLDGLVPVDVNEQWDIYQFEPFGTGSCDETVGGSTTIRSGDGCVGLVSSGAAADESVFFDASATGDDAFFLTPARLSVLDEDSELDVYDARVNGVVAKLRPEAECTGESCRRSTESPGQETPVSAAFTGRGNLKSGKKCPKSKKKVQRGGKTRCVKKKRTARHHKRANRDGRRSR